MVEASTAGLGEEAVRQDKKERNRNVSFSSSLNVRERSQCENAITLLIIVGPVACKWTIGMPNRLLSCDSRSLIHLLRARKVELSPSLLRACQADT